MMFFNKVNLIAVVLLSAVLITFITFNEKKVQAEMDVESVCVDCVVETPKEVISFTPTRVVMEKAGIDLPVVSVPMENGTWKVSDAVANYAEGTSLVNEKTGNVGLFGHALPNAFLNIKNLVSGDMIYVYGDNYKATYEVIQSDKVTPDSVNVFYPEKNPVLTLITCDGVFDQYRYMVRAKFIKIEEL